MISCYVVLFAICIIACNANMLQHKFDRRLNAKWEQFKVTHDKKHSDVNEENKRRSIWESNLMLIENHNREYHLGYHTFEMGLNQYADLTQDEFKQKFMGFDFTSMPTKRIRNTFVSNMNVDDLPKSVNWTKEGWVTPVKNQGYYCGSCYAFSTTGSIEGQVFNASGYLRSLSEQQLIDCTTEYGNYGCHGGWMNKCFEYLAKNPIEEERTYPYKAKVQKCIVHKRGVARVKSFKKIEEGSEASLTEAIARIGPISVAIDASAGNNSFRFYKNGVYSEPDCNNSYLDHAVLAVGYGTTSKGLEYYIVKNSWGTTFGEGGYIKMSRNKNNQCGIASMASYPILEKLPYI